MNTPKGIHYARLHDLTIEEVRACSTFSNCTDEEALELIQTIKKLTTIAYNYYQKQSETFKKPIKNP